VSAIEECGKTGGELNKFDPKSGGVMGTKDKGEGNNEVGVELKYCEHCGGLWVRERGTGVYCNNCQRKVADLPAPKKQPSRIILPVRPHTAVEDYEFDIDIEEITDFEAAGGAA
jgi:hypothetical protein